MIATAKYKILAAALVLAAATASGVVHLRQAEKLGEVRQMCTTERAEYALAAEKAKQEALEEARHRHEEELRVLRAEKQTQAEQNIVLREMFDRTVGSLEQELERLAQQEPEMMPWLDTPVPSSLQPH